MLPNYNIFLVHLVETVLGIQAGSWSVLVHNIVVTVQLLYSDNNVGYQTTMSATRVGRQHCCAESSATLTPVTWHIR